MEIMYAKAFVRSAYQYHRVSTVKFSQLAKRTMKFMRAHWDTVYWTQYGETIGLQSQHCHDIASSE